MQLIEKAEQDLGKDYNLDGRCSTALLRKLVQFKDTLQSWNGLFTFITNRCGQVLFGEFDVRHMLDLAHYFQASEDFDREALTAFLMRRVLPSHRQKTREAIDAKLGAAS